MEVTGPFFHLAKCLIYLEWARPEISSVKLPCVVFKASVNYCESYERYKMKVCCESRPINSSENVQFMTYRSAYT
jgi:hypothetical protein